MALKGKKILIDPEHGGSDNGASGKLKSIKRCMKKIRPSPFRPIDSLVWYCQYLFYYVRMKSNETA